jgi:ABC-type nitrate/sulfonate/bicarbonate transport system ATPase subunit
MIRQSERAQPMQRSGFSLHRRTLTDKGISARANSAHGFPLAAMTGEAERLLCIEEQHTPQRKREPLRWFLRGWRCMFQEPRLLPWLTVEANLRLVARRDSVVAGEIAALLAEVGLASAELLHPKELSLGMARRVALVRAMIGHPVLLVLDEPFASLDPKSAAGLKGVILRSARRDGALVLLTTHDLDQVLGFADRLLLLAGQPARLAADCPTRGQCRMLPDQKSDPGRDAGQCWALMDTQLSHFLP